MIVAKEAQRKRGSKRAKIGGFNNLTASKRRKEVNNEGSCVRWGRR